MKLLFRDSIHETIHLTLEPSPLCERQRKPLFPIRVSIRGYRLAGSIIIASRPFNNRLGPRHKGEGPRLVKNKLSKSRDPSSLPPSRVSRTRHNLTNKYISAGSFAPRENHGLKGRETEGGCYTMRETQERADSIFRGNWIPRRGFGRRKGLKPIPVIVNIYYLSCRSFRFVSTYTTMFKRVGFLVELGNFESEREREGEREGVREFVRLFLVNISCLRVLKVVNLVFIFLN